jgi:hypothetical protein
MKIIENNSKFRLAMVCLLAIFVFVVSGVSAINAQDKKQPDNKQTDKPKVSQDEAKTAKKIEEAKTLAEKMTASEAFLKKYPNSSIRGQIAGYIAEQIVKTADDQQLVENAEKYFNLFSDPKDTDILIPYYIDGLLGLKRYDDAFNYGGNFLGRHPENVRLRVNMVVEGSNLLRINPTQGQKYMTQTRDLANQVIQLIEANKKPADIDDTQWKEFQTNWLAQIYQSRAFVSLAGGKNADARTDFEKASIIMPSDSTNWVMLGYLLNDEYQQNAKLYQGMRDGKERDELLKKINQQLDQIIEYYARVVALTDGNANAQALNAQVRQDLEAYYKYRHKNSTDGLKELIEKYKSPK